MAGEHSRVVSPHGSFLQCSYSSTWNKVVLPVLAASVSISLSERAVCSRKVVDLEELNPFAVSRALVP